MEFDPITLEIVYEYSHKKGLYPFPRNGEFHRFFSTTLCSAQRLPNGNTLVTEGLSGRVFGITPNNEIVWDFVTPDVKNYLYRGTGFHQNGFLEIQLTTKIGEITLVSLPP